MLMAPSPLTSTNSRSLEWSLSLRRLKFGRRGKHDTVATTTREQQGSDVGLCGWRWGRRELDQLSRGLGGGNPSSWRAWDVRWVQAHFGGRTGKATLWRLEYHAKELGFYPEGSKEPQKALEQQKDTITSVLRKMNLSSGRRWARTKELGGGRPGRSLWVPKTELIMTVHTVHFTWLCKEMGHRQGFGKLKFSASITSVLLHPGHLLQSVSRGGAAGTSPPGKPGAGVGATLRISRK